MTDYYSNTGGDGGCQNSGATGVSFATVRAASTGVAVSAANTAIIQTSYASPDGKGGGDLYGVSRFLCPVDTSGIPDGDTISAATFYFTKWANQDIVVHLVGTTQASGTALVGADYGRVAYGTSFGSTTAADGLNSIILNAAGLAFINKAGYTKLALVSQDDYDGTFSVSAMLSVHTTDSASNDPYLSVTHAASASGPAGLKTVNGLAKASVKTVNGLGIASIKSWIGLT